MLRILKILIVSIFIFWLTSCGQEKGSDLPGPGFTEWITIEAPVQPENPTDAPSGSIY